MNLSLLQEELNIRGCATIGYRMPQEDVDWFKEDIFQRKKAEIDQHGEKSLRENGNFDIVRSLIRFDDHYLSLIESDWLNDVVNCLLNEKAIIHDYFGLLNTASDDLSLTRYNFHRDFPSMEGRRCSIHIMIPLIDFTQQNGATEAVPGTHWFDKNPSDEFLEKHAKRLCCRAGEVFVIDSSVIHRAGKNLTDDPRPMLALRYQLSFLKRPIDLCEANASNLPSKSEIVNQRLGWESRSLLNADDDLKKWMPGQYTLENTFRYG